MLTISLISFLYKCIYVFNVVAILLCPKYLAISVILAPFLINNDAQLWRKSWILICFTPDNSHHLFLWSRIVVSFNGSMPPKTNHSSLKFAYLEYSL